MANDLDRQAATYDLSRLEDMESASVIVDRNDKIFGQIYVENRETIPYEQLPGDLINAVVVGRRRQILSAQRLRFVWDRAGDVEERDRWPCATGREHDYATIGAQ